MTGVVTVDAAALERSGPSGALWSLPHGGDLDANVVVVDAGETFAAHANPQVDVLLVVVAGSGTIEVDGEVHLLARSRIVHVPKATSRTIEASRDEPLVYVTVHRSRGPLAIGGGRSAAATPATGRV
jgi:mannose-6-phosphate isomerase-like protein (cupin superfamily)